MRVNVYAEEMTNRLELISKEIEGETFTGLRFYLALPVTERECSCEPQLESCPVTQRRGPFMHGITDDDSAAVTFWGKRDMRAMLAKGIELLDRHYQDGPPAPEKPATNLMGRWRVEGLDNEQTVKLILIDIPKNVMGDTEMLFPAKAAMQFAAEIAANAARLLVRLEARTDAANAPAEEKTEPN